MYISGQRFLIPGDLDWLMILANYLDDQVETHLTSALCIMIAPRSLIVWPLGTGKPQAIDLEAHPIRPTPAWPDWACMKCDLDQHICYFCGDDITHKQGGICPGCKEENA